jgi:glycosyltransferase involved in cell wall biosynthesis
MVTDRNQLPGERSKNGISTMLDVLVVGPAGRDTGGIARYIAEQRRHLSACSVRVYDVQTPEGTGAAGFLLGAIIGASQLMAFPFRRRPDIVHVHTSHRYSFYLSSLYVLFCSVFWRRPVVIHVHGSAFDEFVDTASRPLRWTLALVFGRCAAVIVLSSYWASVLEGLVAPDKLHIMPNAVDVREYEPTFSGRVPHVVFVSNLLRRKGVPELLRALDRLRGAADSPPFRVTIAGDGPLATDVEAFAARSKDVEYLGYVSEPRKRRLLENGTIFVIPSLAEGLPISLLEAMAGGNAVVATNVGSIPEVLDEANGELVPPGDDEALTAAIRRFLVDPEGTESAGRHNREMAVEAYSWTERAEELTTLYQTVVNAAAGPRWNPKERVTWSVRNR